MAEIYNTDRFAELYAASQAVRVEHLGLAGRYLSYVFASNRIPFAFVGGWAMYLRGGHRATIDIDVAVRTDMGTLVEVLQSQARICVPRIFGMTVITIFVHTGGSWEPQFNALPVYVDIIIGGNLGTPVDIPRGTERITPVPTTQGNTRVYVLDVYHQFAAKLAAFHHRHSSSDFEDLRYLIQNHSQKLFRMGRLFNREHGMYFFQQYMLREGKEEWDDYLRRMFRFG